MTLTRKRTLAWPDLTELSWFPFLEPVIRVAGVPGERPQERPSAERLPEPPAGRICRRRHSPPPRGRCRPS